MALLEVFLDNDTSNRAIWVHTPFGKYTCRSFGESLEYETHYNYLKDSIVRLRSTQSQDLSLAPSSRETTCQRSSGEIPIDWPSRK